jgi:hypothetical protein
MAGHRWSDDEMERTIDIVLDHPPGFGRDRDAQALVAQINADPTNRINPVAIGQALRAAEHAIDAVLDRKPRPSKRLLQLVEARRRKGDLTRRWNAAAAVNAHPPR